jgi:hypothetical protein
LHQAQERLAKCQASHAGAAQVQQAQAAVAARDAEVKRWQSIRSAYRNHLEARSLMRHPWRLLDSTRHTSQALERQLQAEMATLERLLDTHGLPVKKKVLDKVRKQLAGVSALVDLWWQRVWQDVQPQVTLTPAWTGWIEELLLPLMSWHDQLSRTRCPRRKAKLAGALAAVRTACERHPITGQLAPTVLAGWKTGAREHAKAFQRASSAVEGRNGYLSQMHHNHRGLPKRRYKVWTVLHNFDCRASDGTTPASRFFRREFPDLFATVLSQIDDLPLPRRRRLAVAASD